jgi:hypothetical protein
LTEVTKGGNVKLFGKGIKYDPVPFGGTMHRKTAPTTRWLFWVCMVFLCVHGGLFIFDVTDPSAFIRGDRALDRLAEVNQLLRASPNSYLPIILNTGAPGDFLQQAVLYSIGGRLFVIFCQIALQLLILVSTCFAALRITKSETIAIVTGAFLLVMPGTLMDPHLLTTETWFTLFLSIGTLSVCQAISADGRIISTFLYYIGFVSLALASSIRPQALLVPFAIATYLSVALPRDRGTICAVGLLSYAIFPISWMTLRFLFAGDLSLGASNADLAFNLGLRADRILALPLETTGRLDVRTFFGIAASHPWASLNTIYSDALDLILNPGANHVFGYYLGLFKTPDGFSWGQIRDQSGVRGVLTELVRTNAGFLVLFVTWTLIHLTVLSGLAIAAFRAVNGRGRTPLWIWIVFIVVATIVASSFGAGLLRWSHRAGIEPLLALLAAYGLFGSHEGAQVQKCRKDVPG